MENQEEKKVSLFREKSLETIESPESLNDYLRVTSPGVWLVLAAVITLLVGGILWSVFGRIDTSIHVAVVADGEKCICFVPYDSLMDAMTGGAVTVEGTEYAFSVDSDVETVIITEETNPYIRVAGGLNVGDMAVEIPVDAALAGRVYTGSVTTESLQPISMLLQ